MRKQEFLSALKRSMKGLPKSEIDERISFYSEMIDDRVEEGFSEEEAVAMIDPRNLDTLLHPQFDAAALKAATPAGRGLGASPGAACGKIVFTAEENRGKSRFCG